MTNRRSLLSALCTGALALLAPVAVWAGKGRRVTNLKVVPNAKWYHIRFVAKTPDSTVWCGLPEPSSGCMCYACTEERLRVRLDVAEDQARELRALLGEARDLLTPVVPFKRKDGALANFTQVHADDITGFVARVDAALK